jgi:hypothetical protein
MSTFSRAVISHVVKLADAGLAGGVRLLHAVQFVSDPNARWPSFADRLGTLRPE